MPITKISAVSTKKGKLPSIVAKRSMPRKTVQKKEETNSSIDGMPKKNAGLLANFFTSPPRHQQKQKEEEEKSKLEDEEEEEEIKERVKKEDVKMEKVEEEEKEVYHVDKKENESEIKVKEETEMVVEAVEPEKKVEVKKESSSSLLSDLKKEEGKEKEKKVKKEEGIASFFQFDFSAVIKGNEESEKMENESDDAPPGFEFAKKKSKLAKFREACKEEDDKRIKRAAQEQEEERKRESEKEREKEKSNDPQPQKKVSPVKDKAERRKETEKLLERMKSTPVLVSPSSSQAPKRPVVVVVPPNAAMKRRINSDSSLLGTSSEKSLADSQPEAKVAKVASSTPDTCLWVDKYKPQSLKDVIYGSRAVADRLLKWLEAWKTTGKPPEGKGKGAFADSARAVLISGPPGIGKTTTALLACEQLGMKPIELNASDARSKASIKEIVEEALGNTSIAAFCQKKKVDTKSVIIMDEVDGMSSGDRGGIAELIAVVKKTRVPVICICNDRQSTKIKSLAAHCLDLRFQKPLPEQVCTRLVLISNMEHAGLSMNEGRRIAAIANCDIRQAIHLLYLSVLSARNGKSITQALDSGTGNGLAKDMDMNPFDVVPRIFAYPRSTLDQKIRYYFSDYGMVPMLVQENYLSTRPALSGVVKIAGKPATHMDLVARAAEAISIADVLDGAIRRTGRWDMLTEHACLSTVYPAYQVQSAPSGQDIKLKFPTWLGKNSTRTKNVRVLKDIQTHMAASVACSVTQNDLVESGFLDLLSQKIVDPMVDVQTSDERGDAISQVASFMESYGLDRADWESICDLSFCDNSQSISAQTKTAFTKKLNMVSEEISVAKGKGGAGKGILDKLNDEQEEAQGDADGFPENELDKVDAMNL